MAKDKTLEELEADAQGLFAAPEQKIKQIKQKRDFKPEIVIEQSK